jgi:hypothetical protein
MPKGCSKCGTQNADDAKFCRGCGASLAPAPVPASAPAVFDDSTVIATPCRACGHLNRGGKRFCAKCGTDMTAKSIPVQVPVPPSVAPTAFEQYEAPSQLQMAPSGAAEASVPFEPREFQAPAAQSSQFDFDRPAPAPNKSAKGLWIGLGLLVVALGAGGAWWFNNSGRDDQIIDELAEPAIPAAPVVVQTPAAPAAVQPTPAEPATPAIATTQAIPVPALPPVAQQPTANSQSGPSSSELLEPIDKNAAPAAPTAQEQADKARAAREARAKALRDQREQASLQVEQDAARRRAEDTTRGRPVPSATQSAQPVPAQPTQGATATAQAPAADPAQANTVGQRCVNRNPIVQSLCEARECLHRSLANDPACQRIRAADENRRQRD